MQFCSAAWAAAGTSVRWEAEPLSPPPPPGGPPPAGGPAPRRGQVVCMYRAVMAWPARSTSWAEVTHAFGRCGDPSCRVFGPAEPGDTPTMDVESSEDLM